ncbi:hypothetical protein PXK00_14320 [Phaeobacter sp. QD34_3]|uniref:hypothetical protein n=1 Tax=unclassified Phaeobacter TaxID=2621772 RepID=UPI00237F7A97|nr:MULTISPECIES: hypothetical protein [unclassified Phaeobacter]MDE4134294.1 hypothetical protein [Phaeobacter sp. QD34_3]MDE4138036.1 hypothetical protein [Phaeobacter sp. QD34_24]MDE4174781.1 hypothetical protein [Phaeobacter sp. PT47_59]
MPLEILLIMVVSGVSLVILILHLSGRSAQTVLSPEDARSAWHRHFPDDDVRQILVAENTHAALVQTDTGTGLLWSFGADTVARHLIDFDVMETPKGLRLDFHDFGTPGVSLTLAPPERARWQQLMTSP